MNLFTAFQLPIRFALALGLTLAATAPALAQTKTLRFVAHADVKILDPSFTTAYITRNFGYMVYDTLFAQDAKGQPKPQMVEKYTTSKDGRQWTFTLRPGLKFSDGNAVSAASARPRHASNNARHFANTPSASGASAANPSTARSRSPSRHSWVINTNACSATSPGATTCCT